ncbi:3-hydroxyacyl-CoA dehydrogenase [Streptomyces luomodiensis]|uniref:3-hydroxyacyl-CoA dehydrogenase n=1 Tax=Streptomyces luomodiensis TaxID=3026192 RepID=A0ABY9V650_9ACTN|nr:3-hydroxyacyl-CoA dehydrogenase [Streptomyces sp. SCA4-21]WNF00338.1 3-hydroxyacyl-CoA dehydrogenase [Streptomyces sp. SCA4-21]
MTEQGTHICVVGAGTMGRGIAQVAINAGHLVSLVDPNQHQLDAAAQDITARLSRRNPEAERLVSERLETARTITDTPPHASTVVIEAVVEDLAVKQRVFNDALRHFGASCVLATNTSSLSVTEIAAGTTDPSRVVGMHFFNPVPVMKLVEVVHGLQSDPVAVRTISDLASAWGKHVARVRSAPGFIVNRVARSFYGEALRLLEEGAASAETIDALMRTAGQFRMGPFELMDLIGVDVNLTVTRTVWSAYNYDSRFAPSLMQQELVAAGRFGRKSGQGFYPYSEGAQRTTAQSAKPGSEPPATVSLFGTSPQLEGLVARSGVTWSGHESDGIPHLEIPNVGTVMVTRGKTAQEESLLQGGPVAVIDRCLDPEQVSALAISSTDTSLADSLIALLGQAGVQAYPVSDAPGLIVARILSMIANEAWETAHCGVASPDDIDEAMVLGTNYPMGPFQWCAQWGATNLLETLDALWAEYHDPRYRASQRLRAHARSSLVH